LVLIDTNVWSELTRSRPDTRVVDFLIANEDRLYLSTLVLAEIEFGIAKAPDPVRTARLLDNRDDVVLRVGDRILQPDFLMATVWGKLKTGLEARGQIIADMDLLIASQAIAAGMPLATRNAGHMARTGAIIVNPWED
jgi:predicted nucleic acid-binding protein